MNYDEILVVLGDCGLWQVIIMLLLMITLIGIITTIINVIGVVDGIVIFVCIFNISVI